VEIGDEDMRRFAEIYAAYDEQCQREGVVDFAELLLRTYEVLSRNEVLREHYRARFRHILVDEFQDTNRLQYRWLKLLAGPKNVMFAVGDDDQSIYRFRGANVGNMAEFERDFRVENVIRLEQNYRSQGNILSAANALIAHNKKRLGKNLWTSAGSGEPVRIYEAQSDGYEASWLAEEVQSLKRSGLALADMGVLYRSNAQSRIIEHALFSAGIPYRVYGGLRFFERMEIKHALAYLRLAANPDDDGAFLRVANFPARGIGARSLETLQDAAKAAGTSLYKAASGLSGKSGASVAAFVRLVESLKAETEKLPLTETVEVMLERSGLLAHYKAERDGADRVENLNELVNAAAAFVEEAKRQDLPTDLGAFLAHASLESGENQAAEGTDALQMMTVHSAKGLEFAAVFVTGLEEGLFPHEQSALEDDGLEEERRLMYVAITRARQRLYLCHAQTRMLHGQTRYNVASRFIDEVPQEVVKRLTPTVVRGRFDDKAWEPAPERAFKAKTAGHGFRIGQAVQHPKFGQGVIVNAEGSGSDARLQINFGKQGMKWLALEYAKITAA
jgi:DNA helicase-2/ATP-dependent DNA helicase PcrA